MPMRRAPDLTTWGIVGVALVRGPHLRLTRDLAMFALGFATFVYEALARTASDPQIVYASLALMGVAAYLRGMGEMDKK